MIQGPACVKERERKIATIKNQRRWLRGVESLELQKVARTSDRSSPWTLYKVYREYRYVDKNFFSTKINFIVIDCQKRLF